MNSLVFNTTAEQLKTSIYGYDSTNFEFKALQLDTSGRLLVSLENSSLTVNIGNSITIGNTNDINVNINGNSFTSEAFPATALTVTDGNILEEDISIYRTATFFVINSGTETVEVSLELSPNGTDYFPSPNHTVTLTNGEHTIIPVEIFAQNARIAYSVSSTTDASLTAYFNAQV